MLRVFKQELGDGGGGGKGMLPGILGAGVPPISPNPDPISDQKMSFSTPVFRLRLFKRYPADKLRTDI